jgi:DNA-binding NarL/FixJ family response regulator
VVRCLIVDDSPSFLVAARRLLEREGLDVVGTASTGAEALQEVESLRPDVVLVDVFLGEESGFELARRLEGAATVILISTHDEAGFEDLIAGSSAAGFLPKASLSASAILGMFDGRPGGVP